MNTYLKSSILAAGIVLNCGASHGASLLHRWKFDDGTDSVGGATATLVGTASLAGNFPKSDFDPTGVVEFNTTGGANPAAMLVNTEYHVITIFDAGTDTQSFYINGVLADTAPMGGFNVTNLSPNTMRFGAGFFYADPDLQGSIDEISIWSGALTPAEVLAEFNAGPDAIGVPGPSSAALACRPPNFAAGRERSAGGFRAHFGG